VDNLRGRSTMLCIPSLWMGSSVSWPDEITKAAVAKVSGMSQPYPLSGRGCKNKVKV